MAESLPFLLSKSRDLLATSNHAKFETLLNHLAKPKEPTQFKSSLSQFNFCASKFPNCLTLMLLKIYQSSSSSDYITRFQSIHLLSSTIDEFRIRNTQLSIIALNEIKPVLISCLKIQESEESELKILRRIVSFVTYNVISLDNNGWEELSDCILAFAETEPLKAFHVFIELPRVYSSFIDRFMKRIVEQAEKVLFLLNQDWSLCLVTLVKMGVQVLDSEMDVELMKKLFSVLVKSVNVLVNQGKLQFLVQGLEDLEVFLVRDKELYGYSSDQCVFVMSLMYKIRDIGGTVKEIAMRVHRLFSPKEEQKKKKKKQDFDRVCFEHLNKLSLVEIVGIVASVDQGEKVKDMAIRRLNLLLSKVEFDVSAMRELQRLLVSCLSKEGISESSFKVLGEVVYRVMNFQEDDDDDDQTSWSGIRDYIVSKSRTEFRRAVYVFQCLTMPLNDKEFVIPVMEILLPEIKVRLNSTPIEVLVDNSGWVLAFTGAFCSVIHLIEVENYGESVKEIAYKMIDSVRELVEKGMEVGIVRRGFRDMESVLKKHLEFEWFGVCEYKFVKGLVRRLYEIKGMTMESKIVLWRINFRLERRATDLFKELLRLNKKLNWLNQNEED